MALLDELKKEAERIRVEGNVAKTQEDRLRAFYEEHTKPTLQRLYVYLNDLRDQLNIIKPDIAANYEVPGIGSVNTLMRNHIIQIDSANNTKQLSFTCTAVASELQRGTILKENVAEDARGLFNRIKQPFSEWPVRGLSGNIAGFRFEFTLNVPASVHFTADIPNQAILMISSNMEGFRIFKHRMQPMKMDEAWMDKLGLYLLRRGPDPSVTILTEEEREKLRQHLRATRDRYI